MLTPSLTLYVWWLGFKRVQITMRLEAVWTLALHNGYLCLDFLVGKVPDSHMYPPYEQLWQLPYSSFAHVHRDTFRRKHWAIMDSGGWIGSAWILPTHRWGLDVGTGNVVATRCLRWIWNSFDESLVRVPGAEPGGGLGSLPNGSVEGRSTRNFRQNDTHKTNKYTHTHHPLFQICWLQYSTINPCYDVRNNLELTLEINLELRYLLFMDVSFPNKSNMCASHKQHSRSIATLEVKATGTAMFLN